ncbi:MAG TPA: hypothetical protein VE130_01290 [Nitrososphaeraceae archaeon]|nr:hypothetical protein [Nitrososphaeraceae archaeon]
MSGIILINDYKGDLVLTIIIIAAGCYVIHNKFKNTDINSEKIVYPT